MFSVSLSAITGAAVSITGESTITNLVLQSIIGGVVAAVAGYLAVELIKVIRKKKIMKKLIENIWKGPVTTAIGALVLVVGLTLLFIPEGSKYATELLYFGVSLLVVGPALFLTPDKRKFKPPSDSYEGEQRNLQAILVLFIAGLTLFSCSHSTPQTTIIRSDSIRTVTYKDTTIYVKSDSVSAKVDYRAIMKRLHDLKRSKQKPVFVYKQNKNGDFQLRFKLDSINNLVAQIYKREDSLLLKQRHERINKVTEIIKEVPFVKKKRHGGKTLFCGLLQPWRFY